MTTAFDEAQVRRGQPDNAGKFRAKESTAPVATLAATTTRVEHVEFSDEEHDVAARACIGAAIDLDVVDEDFNHGSDGAASECDIDDLTPETRAELEDDIASFLESNADTIRKAMDAQPGYTMGNVGNDFWLTRQGHGAGFWDRGLGELGDELTVEAKVYGGKDLFLLADGSISG